MVGICISRPFIRGNRIGDSRLPIDKSGSSQPCKKPEGRIAKSLFNKPPFLLYEGPWGRLFSFSTIGLNKFLGREDPAFFCGQLSHVPLKQAYRGAVSTAPLLTFAFHTLRSIRRTRLKKGENTNVVDLRFERLCNS